MEGQLSPVLNGIRSAALLEGRAHINVVRAARKDNLKSFSHQIAPLILAKALPSIVFDKVNDANYFVINVDHLLKRTAENVIIVDVSPTASLGVIKPDHRLYEVLRAKIEIIKNVLRGPGHGGPTGIIEILDEGQIDSVILGWILGYPILYWSDDSSHNSLSDEQLCVVSLSEAGSRTPFTSFSVPVKLMDLLPIANALRSFYEEIAASGLVTISQRFVSLPKVSL